jgi:hypothetical protein
VSYPLSHLDASAAGKWTRSSAPLPANGQACALNAFQQVREILRVGYGRFNSYRPSDAVSLNSGPASNDQLTISPFHRSSLMPVPTWNSENDMDAR